MAIRLKEYYRKFGIRLLQQFVSPPKGDYNQLTLPIASVFHYYSFNVTNLSPSSDSPMFNIKTRAPVINISKLESPTGTFKEVPVALNSIVSKLKRINKKFLYLEPKKTISVSMQIPIIYNYGLLNKTYRYTVSRMNDYYVWRNTLNTVYVTIKKNISKQDRVHYLFLDLPSNVPSKIVLDKHSKEITPRTLREFITPDELTILDIWKWLNPDYRKDSLLSKFTNEELAKIIFIVRSNKGFFLLNLGVVNESIKELKVPTSRNRIGYKLMQKLFLSMMVKMVVENDDISEFREKVGLIEDIDTEVNENADLTEILKEADEDVKALDEKEKIDKIKQIKKEPEKILETDDDPINTPKKIVKEFKEFGLISGTESKKLKEALKKQKKAKSPYNDGTTLIENLTYTEKDLTLDENETIIPDMPQVTDKRMLKSSLNSFDKSYIKKTMKKDILSSFYAIQKTGLVIMDHKVEESSSALGDVEVHTIKVKPLNGKASTLKLRIPKVNENGVYKMSGNSYVLRKQRADKPIRKIKFNRIALSSYYGKVFVDKAIFKRLDMGFWFKNKLAGIYNTGTSNIKNLITTTTLKPDLNLPLAYSIIARYVKAFEISKRKYYFDYKKRDTILGKDILSKIEKKGRILIGREGSKPIVMDNKENIILLDGKEEKGLPDIFTQVGVEISKAPVEYALARVFSTYIPIGMLLSFYIGIESLLKLLKANYSMVDKNKRIQLNSNDWVIKFKDKKLIFSRDDRMTSMIMASFNHFKKELTNYNFTDFNNKDVYIAIFSMKRIPSIYIKEMELLDSLFIDPITKTVLESMGEPTTFRKLLIRSCEMLLDDNYREQQDMRDMVIKGYERIPGMIYRHMVESVRTFENKNIYSKTKMDLDPFAVWRSIGEDSANSLVDDLNPIAMLKQVEDVTALGMFGRSKETMNKESRAFHITDIGIISEAVKDSGDVGISAYMPANPKLKNLRGEKGEFNFNEDGAASILSTSAMLAAGATHDDPKRTNFISIQNSHIVPIKGQSQAYVRTGYDNVLPYRVNERFAFMAPQPGLVKKVSKKKIKVVFKDKSEKTLTLGKVSTKIESGVGYVHELITPLKKGDMFKEGDVIMYNSAFFEPDFFDKSKIVYKAAKSIRVAMLESKQTHEDSCAVSKDIAGELSTTIYKVKSFILRFDQHILNMVKIGTELKPNDNLFVIEDAIAGSSSLFSSDSLKALQKIKGKAPKAKVKGKLDKIEIYYNGETSEMTDSLKKLVKKTDKTIAESLGKKITGQVTSEYSIKGKPLLPNTLEIKLYIEVEEKMGTGDKGIFGHQLKTTVSEVYDYELNTVDGRKVDAVFGERAVQARMVTSAKIIGTTTTLLDIIAEKAIEAYEK
jgi:hypothetical protein